MIPRVYCNDIDKNACHWLSKLSFGFEEIDSRSIKDVKGDELRKFNQCHFFAGIGGWPLALELAGWPIDAPVWTGSCPCQPFSAAGKRKGTKDERHLWPEFRRLIDECKPSTIFGEQVASKDGRDWLATVRADLEALEYEVGAADLCAAGVGAPHIRQRLFWVADRNSGGLEKHSQRDRKKKQSAEQTSRRNDTCGCSTSGRLADSSGSRLEKWEEQPTREELPTAQRSCDASRMGDTEGDGWRQGSENGGGSDPRVSQKRKFGRSTGNGCGMWTGCDFIECRDGKARPVKPGVRLLAHGIPGRVAQLRGLGNAIVPKVAAEFIAAFMQVKGIGE